MGSPVITLVPLSGFLGSGKTTTLISAAVAMQRTGRRVAVVTNDAGPAALVDTELARAGLGDVVEVAGGCLCHRQEELAVQVTKLAETGDVDTVIVESSGSCPDIRSALAPLRRRLGDEVAVAPLTAVVDPLRLAAFARVADRCGREYELAYLFGRQLAAADLLAVNKTDLIGAERTAKIEARLAADHPHATVMPYSAITGTGLDELVRVWSRETASAERGFEFDFDYARYAEAEAKLAWVNQAAEIEAVGETFDALVWGRTVLRFLSAWSATAGYFLGHAKVAVRTRAGLAKLSVTETGAQPRADRTAARPVERGSATVNVRVACRPSALDEAVSAAIKAADAFSAARSDASPSASFQAAQPLPPQLERLPLGTNREMSTRA
jgi:G3E family GTPase